MSFRSAGAFKLDALKWNEQITEQICLIPITFSIIYTMRQWRSGEWHFLCVYVCECVGQGEGGPGLCEMMSWLLGKFCSYKRSHWTQSWVSFSVKSRLSSTTQRKSLTMRCVRGESEQIWKITRLLFPQRREDQKGLERRTRRTVSHKQLDH